MMQTRPDQQSNDQHQSNKCADAVPAIVMPENTTQRPGNTRPQIVTEQIQRGGSPLARFARGPIQLLATEWAAKNPAEKSNIPAKISHSELNKVISKPNSITPSKTTSPDRVHSGRSWFRLWVSSMYRSNKPAIISQPRPD